MAYSPDDDEDEDDDLLAVVLALPESLDEALFDDSLLGTLVDVLWPFDEVELRLSVL